MKKLAKSIGNYSRDVTDQIELKALAFPPTFLLVTLAMAFLMVIQIAVFPLLIFAIIARNMLRPRRYFCRIWLLMLVRYTIGLLALPSMTAEAIMNAITN